MQKNVNIKLYKGIILFILFWKITFYKTCQLKKLNETFIKKMSVYYLVCLPNKQYCYICIKKYSCKILIFITIIKIRQVGYQFFKIIMINVQFGSIFHIINNLPILLTFHDKLINYIYINLIFCIFVKRGHCLQQVFLINQST